MPSLLDDCRWFNLLDASLYGLMCAVALSRIGKKCYCDGGCRSMSNKSRFGMLVLIILVVYCVSRCIDLSLHATGVLPNNQTLRQQLSSEIPGGLLMVLQTFMIAKWVRHVSELTFALTSQRFQVGTMAVSSSGAMLVASLVASLMAYVDYFQWQFVGLSESDWKAVVSCFGGAVFMYNGAVFIALGVYLTILWRPVTSDGIVASRRVLAIALVFGLMCVSRGAILWMFIDRDPQTKTTKVADSSWGAPAVLLCEWVLIAVSLLALTTTRTNTPAPTAIAVSSPLNLRRKYFGIASFPNIDDELVPNSGGRSFPAIGSNRAARVP